MRFKEDGKKMETLPRELQSVVFGWLSPHELYPACFVLNHELLKVVLDDVAWRTRCLRRGFIQPDKQLRQSINSLDPAPHQTWREFYCCTYNTNHSLHTNHHIVCFSHLDIPFFVFHTKAAAAQIVWQTDNLDAVAKQAVQFSDDHKTVTLVNSIGYGYSYLSHSFAPLSLS